MAPDMNHVTATRYDRLVMRHTVDCWRPLWHPAYNRFDARLKSFESWPKHWEATSPASLSDAGFFYDGTCRHNFEYLFLFQFHIFILLIRNFFITGRFDETTCFHCGIGLYDWSLSDDAWHEHVCWSPFCLYVYEIKGATFVRRTILCGTPIIWFVYAGPARSQRTH